MKAVSKVEPPLFRAKIFLDQFLDFLLSTLHTFSYAYPIQHQGSFFLLPSPLLASEFALSPFPFHLQQDPALPEAAQSPFSEPLLSSEALLSGLAPSLVPEIDYSGPSGICFPVRTYLPSYE